MSCDPKNKWVQIKTKLLFIDKNKNDLTLLNSINFSLVLLKRLFEN